MAVTNRADLIVRTHQVLKRHFKPVHPPKRSVFEHMLFACCLENSGHDDAEDAFARLCDQYIDWNEIRVSTTIELTEVMKGLNDPKETAIRIKRVLQGVFEAIYSFELDALTKENIGQAAKKIRNFGGTTPFVIAYVIQQGLAGHAIPVNVGLLESFHILGIISDSEAEKGVVPGLERAIPKNHGVEVGSIMHNLGVLYSRNPYSPAVRKLLLEIVPECKDRLPRRPSKKSPPPESPIPREPTPAPDAKSPDTETTASASKKESAAKKTTKKSAAKPSTKKSVSAKDATEKRQKGTIEKSETEQSEIKISEIKISETKKAATKKTTTKKTENKKTVPKKTAAKKPIHSKQAKKKTTSKKSASHTQSQKTSPKKQSKKTGKTTRKTTTKKSETKKLSKRKPR